MSERVGAILAAAGQGERLGLGPKALVPLAGLPLLAWALQSLRGSGLVEEVAVVVPPGAEEEVGHRVRDLPGEAGAVCTVVPGGAHRQESVSRGLAALSPAVRWVVVHDVARPLATADLVVRVVEAAREAGAALAAVPVVDTLKEGGATVRRTVPREGMWQAQTPQAFRRDLLEEAHRRARVEGYLGTDDSVLVERLGHPVRLVSSSRDNLKVTVAEDLELAESVVRGRWGMRVGMGFDIHPLAPGRPLVLAGVEVPSPVGLAGHSDGDVICHALMDALLGAAGERDIGFWFPPSDPRFRGAHSRDLLGQVVAGLAGRGLVPVNADVTVVAEEPRLAPFIPAMKASLAAALGVDEGMVAVKATTAEGLGALGRREGMAAWAVCAMVAAGRRGT
ncbi:MAG: 2-C-methyl-D-erythritol 4-phosphate cytidylyltransferase [Bacillota bacterium]|nr:2-C-methyl-D-erythritol 4-phosphate cytidylyltransferase [Bacillota bacterium]